MKIHALKFGAAAAAFLTVSACNQGGNAATNGSGPAQSEKAQEAAGNKTIASGLPADGKFMAAAKAAGLDQTLAGPGPYTVLVPDDAAFASAPEGALDAKPENRAALTGAITNMILPGTVLAADIDEAIEAGKGKAVIATMGGGTITATKEGGKTVLSDSSGHKASISKADDQFSNGVVHHIDTLLVPSQQAKAAEEKPQG